MNQPFTLSAVEKLADPALFVAVHVYTPVCLWFTAGMLRKLALGPA